MEFQISHPVILLAASFAVLVKFTIVGFKQKTYPIWSVFIEILFGAIWAVTFEAANFFIELAVLAVVMTFLALFGIFLGYYVAKSPCKKSNAQ